MLALHFKSNMALLFYIAVKSHPLAKNFLIVSGRPNNKQVLNFLFSEFKVIEL